MQHPEILRRCEIRLEIAIRPCVREDLPTLWWFGLFSPQLIQEVFDAYRRGEAWMFVLEANGVASGQIWVDLGRREMDLTGYLWALRVFPNLQKLGLGRKLLAVAEERLAANGFSRAELSVERSKPGLRRYYERLGYAEFEPTPASLHASPLVQASADQWQMRKELTVAEVARSEESLAQKETS